MRKEAAYLLVLGVFCLSASSAQADPVVVGNWPLDEGSGQLAADVSGFASNGSLGATPGADSADPDWIAGHAGGSALDFNGAQYVAVPDSATLEPAHVAVDAWVRRDGSPGNWRYVLSKGSLSCDRSAYGLYSGWSGGLAFYVSSTTQYVLSPEVPASRVWDGSWHHVVGSYDGAAVRLWIDGLQVGDGTPASLAIAYGVGSKGVYIGSYRGSCDLGFFGAIDDVRVWNDIPATAIGGPVIPPVPGTPTVVTVGGTRSAGSSSTATKGKSPAGVSSTPKGCLRVTLSRHTVPVRRRALVLATVRRSKKRLAGVHVVVRGEGVDIGASTNKKGTARIVVRARKPGRLTVRVRGQKASCPAPTVRAR
jgi:Concanavalin A-like lectin/glucanases superfamily